MGEFLRTWYGLTLFIVFDAAAAIAVLAIGWRWVFKRIFDFLASVVCMAVLSPAFLAVFVRGKLLQRRTGEPRTLISREYCVGKKAKADCAARLSHRQRSRGGGEIQRLAETDGIV